jgi:hypothetical protein
LMIFSFSITISLMPFLRHFARYFDIDAILRRLIIFAAFIFFFDFLSYFLFITFFHFFHDWYAIADCISLSLPYDIITPAFIAIAFDDISIIDWFSFELIFQPSDDMPSPASLAINIFDRWCRS